MPRPLQPAENLASVAGDAGKERVGTVEVGAGAGANHEGAEQGAGLEIFLTDGAGERAVTSGGTLDIDLIASAETVQGRENLVGDFGLDGDEVERGHADGSTGADAEGGDVEQLPVEVEAVFRAQEAAGEDKDTSRRWPTESGSICAMGRDMRSAGGRTTRAGIRARRAAMASARANP